MTKKEIHIIIKDVEPNNPEEMNNILSKLINVLIENNVDPADASFCLCEILCAFTVDAEIDKEQFIKTVSSHYEQVLKNQKDVK